MVKVIRHLSDYHVSTWEPGKPSYSITCEPLPGYEKVIVRHNGKIWRYDVPDGTSMRQIKHALKNMFKAWSILGSDGNYVVRMKRKDGKRFN